MNRDFLNGYGAGVGLQFNLAPQRAPDEPAAPRRCCRPAFDGLSSTGGGRASSGVDIRHASANSI
jgi:hypothetical protein